MNGACRQRGFDVTPSNFYSLSFSSGHGAACFVSEHLKALSYLKGLRKPALRVVPI